MRLSKEQLEEFKQIYKSEFGEELSDKEALYQATDLVNLIKVTYKPIKKREALDYINGELGKTI